MEKMEMEEGTSMEWCLTFHRAGVGVNGAGVWIEKGNLGGEDQDPPPGYTGDAESATTRSVTALFWAVSAKS
jgi:hypothetical protein